MMMAEHLRTDDGDAIRTVTIDRPEVKNALTRRMRADLCALLAGAASRAAEVNAGLDPEELGAAGQVAARRSRG
jgi:enoyl-CoA hydratase/carnithine racemase